jgi:glyoxylase-like metal-dependent hydrolase (beta-lactamase superfamily II)
LTGKENFNSAEVKVLIEGYAKTEGDEEVASSTTTLIRENNLNILVDPGMNRELLFRSLKKENLSINDIQYVVLTHTHIDHCLLAGIFEKAVILDDSSAYTFDGKIKEHDGRVPGTDIKIIKTPGHDQFHCAVVVDTANLGKVVVAADVFWWKDCEEQKTDKESLINYKDPYMKNEKQLTESRKKIIEIADYIIPGHGKMFKVKH